MQEQKKSKTASLEATYRHKAPTHQHTDKVTIKLNIEMSKFRLFVEYLLRVYVRDLTYKS